ncbi:hypothetical protein DPEC_G00291540 [Dallia pectoralis]|uniref:Uncharacterized protein n=1 Tax=Dallia pectoralis TaxID=75939 RepID=A0ACC2FHZ0_DALPE|nr:hypothetical protein DPEC_G00291540 [Dallia pectoralis]
MRGDRDETSSSRTRGHSYIVGEGRRTEVSPRQPSVCCRLPGVQSSVSDWIGAEARGRPGIASRKACDAQPIRRPGTARVERWVKWRPSGTESCANARELDPSSPDLAVRILTTKAHYAISYGRREGERERKLVRPSTETDPTVDMAVVPIKRIEFGPKSPQKKSAALETTKKSRGGKKRWKKKTTKSTGCGAFERFLSDGRTAWRVARCVLLRWCRGGMDGGEESHEVSFSDTTWPTRAHTPPHHTFTLWLPLFTSCFLPGFLPCPTLPAHSPECRADSEVPVRTRMETGRCRNCSLSA